MILKMFTDSLLNELKTNVKTNLSLYEKGERFVDDIIENYDTQLYNLETEVSYPELDCTIASKENQLYQWEIDFNNAVRLHKSLIQRDKVPLSILTDERFISYLAHDIYFGYMKVRWPYNGKEGRILEKYFLQGRSYTRNTFFRYFWYTSITYSENLDDPYELTKVAFENQDVVNQIMERKFSRNSKITKAALRAILDTNTKIPSAKRTLLGKSINNMLSLYSLDVMKEQDLIELFKNEIIGIIGSDAVDDSPTEEE